MGLTREEIMGLEGRELDAAVAEHVMGLKEGVDFGEWPEHDYRESDDLEWPVTQICRRCSAMIQFDYYLDAERREPGPCRVDPPEYSSDIAAAWKVVEELRHRSQQNWEIRIAPDYIKVSNRDCEGMPVGWWDTDYDETILEVTVKHARFEVAICRAALLAVAGEVTKP